VITLLQPVPLADNEPLQVLRSPQTVAVLAWEMVALVVEWVLVPVLVPVSAWVPELVLGPEQE